MPDRIVELDGVQHHFPGDATDTEIAQALHSQPQGAGDQTTSLQALHGVRPTSAEPADWKTNLGAALEPMAQPQTAGDIAGLLIPSGGAEVLGKTLAPVGAAVKKYGGAAAKLAATAGTALMPSAMVAPAKAAISVLGELNPFEWNSPLTVAGREGRAHAAVAEQVDRYLPNKGGLPTSGTVAPSAGRVPYAPPTPTSAGTAAATAPLSNVDFARQELEAGRITPRQFEAVQRYVQQPPKPSPGMIRTSAPPITVSPESAVQPPAPSPLQQPRTQIGAEVVGRQNGLTTQAVRQQTGPLFNEAPGQASPVFPEKPFERMHDKLLAMGHGNPERLDYVKAAADPKTAGLLEAMRRTLERNGLVLGGMTGAEAIRRAVLDKLQGEPQP